VLLIRCNQFRQAPGPVADGRDAEPTLITMTDEAAAVKHPDLRSAAAVAVVPPDALDADRQAGTIAAPTIGRRRQLTIIEGPHEDRITHSLAPQLLCTVRAKALLNCGLGLG